MNTEKIFGDNMAPDEREKMLDSLCVKKERTTFTQALSDDELQISSADYIRGSIDLKRMEGQAKEVADEWKKKIKDKESALEEMLDMLNNGRREVTGILFHIPNHADQKMLLYNKHGELIDSRPLKADEKQARAFIDGPGGTIANPDDHITDIDHEEVSADAAIEEMYSGPSIAGSAEPEDGIEDRFDDKPTKFSDTEAFQDLPEGHIPGSAGFDYESREFETKGFKDLSTDKKDLAWDDPAQTRVVPDGKEAEEGVKAVRRGRKKKE